MHVYVQVYICIHKYTCVYIHKCNIYVCTYIVNLPTYIHICMNIYTYMHTCMHMQPICLLHTSLNVNIHIAHIHAHMHISQGCGSLTIFPVVCAQGTSHQVISNGEKTKN